MRSMAIELRDIIDKHLGDLINIPEEQYSWKPGPAKWSKKEILGHLVDSAQNNIRRFVVAQYEETPFIKYNQDKWVLISGYQHWQTADVIQLWYLLNKQVCYILENTSPEMFGRTCLTDSPHSIEWLAEDYTRHLRHHLHVILDLEPIPYP
jgi:hypothetical protein